MEVLDPRLPVKLALYLAIITALHVAAMMAFEGMSLIEGLWLTATTITTVGYGDLSAKTPEGRLATMALMYVGAIFVLAGTINTWLDRKADRRERQAHGTWKWKMRDHLLILGTPAQEPTPFFVGLARQIRASHGWRDVPILILTQAYGEGPLPRRLADDGVVHYAGHPGLSGDLAAVDAVAARGIIVLADKESDPRSDALTFDTVHRLRALGYGGPLVAEVVDDVNRDRVTIAGATATVRPLRSYLEMLVRGLVAPGTERIIEDLFTAEGDECLRIDLASPVSLSWPETVSRVVGSGVGTPIAIRTPAGEVVPNPRGKAPLSIAGVYVIVHDDSESTAPETVRRVLAS